MLTFEQVKFLGNLKTLSSAENQLQLESEMWLCDGVNMQWEKHRKNPSSTHFESFACGGSLTKVYVKVSKIIYTQAI